MLSSSRPNFTGRRWTFYVLLIWTGVLLVSMIFLVPETYHPVYVLQDSSRRRNLPSDL